MESFCGVLSRLKPYIVMLSLQFGFAGMYIISMLSLKRGLNHYVLAVYRHAVATVAMAPFALVLERKIRPKMTFSIFFKIMVLGFLEPVFDQNLYYVGMQKTNASFASAIFNVLPATTFILAVIFRLEKVKIKNIRSQAKVIGTIVTVAGAMIMTVYKGPLLHFVGSRGPTHHETNDGAGGNDWIKGTFMLLASCTGWAAFFVVQTYTLKAYPAELSLTTLICLTGMVQGAVVALVAERDLSVWSIGFDTRLLAPIYTGLVCSGLAYYIQGMVIKQRGPVFVAAFNPLCMIIVAILGSTILGDEIRLGRVIGAIVIVIGLYSVVWGKSKDPVGQLSSIDQKGGASELPIAKADVVKVSSGDDCVANGGVMLELPAKKTSTT